MWRESAAKSMRCADAWESRLKGFNLHQQREAVVRAAMPREMVLHEVHYTSYN